MADVSTVPPLPVDPGWGSIVKTSGMLFLILGFIMVAFWLLKKYGPAGLGRPGGPDGPELKSRLMLGNKQSVSLVRVRDRLLVLGVTEQNITLLKDMKAEDGLEEFAQEDLVDDETGIRN